MSKYTALWDHIRRSGKDELLLTFEEIGRESTDGIFSEDKGMRYGRTRARQTIRRFAVCVALIFGLVSAGCGTGNVFSGHRVCDEDGFSMDYSAFNRQECAELSCVAGDALRVSIAQTSGTVDLTIGVDGKEPVYEGNGLTAADFTVNLSEDGIYRITVTGHHAEGSVSFQKKHSDQSQKSG